MSELLDKTQVAKLLNVSSRSVDRLRRAAVLRAVKIGNRVRFRPDDINLFISNHVERVTGAE